MREIKFRCWHKKENRWLSQFSLTNDGIVLPAGGLDSWNFVKQDMSLMQYTGRKDRNGKEIYEGDIVEQKDPGKVYLIFEVNYHQFVGGISFGHQDVGGNYLEVIGNIWENPELIGKEIKG